MTKTPPKRNEPCACGSGKKFKKCHYLIDHEKAGKVIAESRAISERAKQPESEAQRTMRARRLREFGRDVDGRPLPNGHLLPLLKSGGSGDSSAR